MRSARQHSRPAEGAASPGQARALPRWARAIGARPLLLVLVAFALAIAALGYFFFRRQQMQFRASARSQLDAVADLKQESIHRWRQERLADGEWILNASVIPARVRALSAETEAGIPADLQGWLDGWQHQGRYSRVLLLDRSGRVHAVAPADASATVEGIEPALAEAVRGERVVWDDLRRSAATGRIAAGVVVPLFVREAGGSELAGAVYLEIDPGQFLFAQIQTWPIPSVTAETLLARREGDTVLFLNHLRHRADTALALRLPLTRRDAPAVRGALGETGVFEGLDYRGVPVLAAVRRIPGSDWIVVAKQDLKEIDASLRAWAWMLGGSTATLIAGAAAGVGFVWRTREMHFHRLEAGERQAAAAVVKESEARLALALESAQMGVWRVTLPDEQRHFDAQTCRLLGLDPADFRGTPGEFYARVHPEDRPEVMAAWARSVAEAAPYDAEYRAVWPDGSVHYVTSHGRPAYNAAGQPCGLNGLIWDTTARRQVEETLREANARLEEAQRITRLGSYRFEVKTGQWTSSRTLDEIFGVEDSAFPRDVDGWMRVVHPEDRAEMLRHLMDEVLGQRRRFNHAYRILRLNDGALRWVQGLGELERNAAGEPIAMVGTIQDITERKTAELALRASQRRLALHVEHTPLAVIEWDLASRVVAWNRAAERIFGYTAAEALGRTADELIVPPSQRGRTAAEGPAARRSNTENYTRSGRLVLCDWFDTPLVDEAGVASGMASLVLDATERRRHEEERDLLLHELQRKNEELEGILYVASHDLRAPLVNVQGFAQRLEQACADLVAQPPGARAELPATGVAAPRERIAKALGYIRSSAEKMDGLISGLLRVARLGRTTVNRQPVDMERLLRGVETTLAFQIMQARAEVRAESLPPCFGDPVLLGQVFANLLDNALKYRDPGRPLQIVVSGRLEERDVIYCVSDTGVGIAPAHLDKIWEMFHRLNPEGPVAGEGLGLKVVRRIVDRHRGRVWVESTPGAGSRFFVVLPAADDRPAAVPDAS